MCYVFGISPVALVGLGEGCLQLEQGWGTFLASQRYKIFPHNHTLTYDVCDGKQSLAAGKKARLCGEFVRVKRANIKFLKLLTAMHT